MVGRQQRLKTAVIASARRARSNPVRWAPKGYDDRPTGTADRDGLGIHHTDVDPAPPALARVPARGAAGSRCPVGVTDDWFDLLLSLLDPEAWFLVMPVHP